MALGRLLRFAKKAKPVARSAGRASNCFNTTDTSKPHGRYEKLDEKHTVQHRPAAQPQHQHTHGMDEKKSHYPHDNHEIGHEKAHHVHQPAGPQLRDHSHHQRAPGGPEKTVHAGDSHSHPGAEDVSSMWKKERKECKWMELPPLSSYRIKQNECVAEETRVKLGVRPLYIMVRSKKAWVTTGPLIVRFRDRYLQLGNLSNIQVPLQDIVTDLKDVTKPKGTLTTKRCLLGPLKTQVPVFTVGLCEALLDKSRHPVLSDRHPYVKREVYLLAEYSKELDHFVECHSHHR